MQERQRLLPDGGVEQYLKPRITTDLSDGRDASVNAGVDPLERGAVLPTNQHLGVAAAVVDEAAKAAGMQAGMWAVDLESAYRFCPVQRADWFTQCSIWAFEDGRAGVVVDTRLCFGGAYAPNRFDRITTLLIAAIRREQEQFDGQHPPPPEVVRWAAARGRLQRDGVLPMGSTQTSLSYRHGYIDDLTGCCVNDTITDAAACLASLPKVSRGEATSTGVGGAAVLEGSRVDAHLRIAVRILASMGLQVAEAKTMTGRVIVSLGLLMSLEDGTMACPRSKRKALIQEASELEGHVRGRQPVKRRRVETLVGRLSHISQALPELIPHLAAGYRVAHAPREMVTLDPRSRCGRDFSALMRAVQAIVGSNEGVALAPRKSFPTPSERGVLTTITDASGVDGVGGYAFHSDLPNDVFVMSARWPADIMDAITRCQAKAEQGKTDGERCPMPAAELYGTLALAAAVQGLAPFQAVVAVTDCDPAARVVNSASSASPVMQHLVLAARRTASQWLGVHVRRELNQDADRLSHPQLASGVVARAEAAGLRVTMVDCADIDWEPLRGAISAEAEGWEWRPRHKA